MKSFKPVRGVLASLMVVCFAACFVEQDTSESVEEIDDPEVEMEGGVGSTCNLINNPCDGTLTCCIAAEGGGSQIRRCRDTNTDDNNCGACGHECVGALPNCVAGVCTGPF